MTGHHPVHVIGVDETGHLARQQIPADPGIAAIEREKLYAIIGMLTELTREELDDLGGF
jgi:hypothetical protein